MTTYKNKIRNAFDKAHDYNRSAHVQKIVVRQLIAKIKKLYQYRPHPVSILEVGCGTGFLTQELLKLFPTAQFTITDISSNMIEYLKQNYKNTTSNIHFEVMDGENPSKNYHSFDLICSSLAFQWFENLPTALQQLSNLLTPNGYLVCSTLSEGNFIEWKHLYESNGYSNSFQQYPSIDRLQTYWPSDHGHGYWEEEKIIDRSISGYQFIKDLRSIGAHTPRNMHRPLSAGRLRKIIDQFDTNYGYTTYQIAYGIFQRFAAKGYFVTGTDTDVGKTFISACLVKLLNALYWKPIQTGLNCDPGDTNTICKLTGLRDQQIIPPLIELQHPLSPEAAAEIENIKLDIHQMNFTLNDPSKTYIVEGAGGIFVPIAENQFMIDCMKKINLPVIIVARTSLGTLNHTLLTIECLRHHHIPIAGVILNGSSNPANKKAIERHGKVRVIAEIPKAETVDARTIKDFCKKLSLFN
ncbi:dethiobiotin synthase [Commensalibacter oyaizuii]|uniref:ATP-dependent dethiobiotin synthetase BioD n=1 Tax=Commensalibacter oyaizuii TaxID=3043873 RepID=A0ABT6PZE7_9PROT|nr:dethiobiotin synthase [Commensalibacter sp. TBRC 16381]MDI2090232.1 dethiobiotin synthase [Commensalibacter sp. TBRC 16381]